MSRRRSKRHSADPVRAAAVARSSRRAVKQCHSWSRPASHRPASAGRRAACPQAAVGPGPTPTSRGPRSQVQPPSPCSPQPKAVCSSTREERKSGSGIGPSLASMSWSRRRTASEAAPFRGRVLFLGARPQRPRCAPATPRQRRVRSVSTGELAAEEVSHRRRAPRLQHRAGHGAVVCFARRRLFIVS